LHGREAYLDVAMGVPVEQQLVADGAGQEVKHGAGFLRELLAHHVGRVALGHQLVELGDQAVDLRHELDEALGQEHDAKVLARLGPLHDDAAQLVRQVGQRLLARRHLLCAHGTHQPARDKWCKSGLR
jgi:hypothetical protein